MPQLPVMRKNPKWPGRKYALTLLLLLLGYLSPGQKQIVRARSHSKTRAHRKSHLPRYGTASYYAKKFNGRRTANGEIYRDSAYTAACNVLALGTWIRVTNLRNKKSVVVKVNDRLNARNKRLVDLSRAAARKLGFIGRGLTRVKVEVIKRPTQKESP